MELRFNESSSDEYQNQSEVMAGIAMSESPNWTPQPLRNSNNNSGGGKVRQKRDFRFQVIQIRQGPKWFIWPSNKDESQDVPKKNGSNQENTGVHSMEETSKKDLLVSQTMVDNPANSTASVQLQTSMQSNLQLRRTNRLSGRRKFQVQPVVETITIEGEMTRVTSTKHSDNAPLSEPTIRRLTCKTSKSLNIDSLQKSNTNTIDSCCSTSVPSQTFKILSISKKWDSDDEEEDLLECSCRQMSLSLDDQHSVTRPGQNAVSGVHLVITPPPESNANKFTM